MRRWWRKLFAPPPPSTYLFRHLARTGFALDDLISGHAGDPRYQDVIDTVQDMMVLHHDPGLAGRAAELDVRRLAMRLASQGR